MHSLNIVIIAPMTTTNKSYPTRVPVIFNGQSGFVVLDQIRAVDKSRFVQRLGHSDKNTGIDMLKVLREMFED